MEEAHRRWRVVLVVGARRIDELMVLGVLPARDEWPEKVVVAHATAVNLFSATKWERRGSPGQTSSARYPLTRPLPSATMDQSEV